MSSLLRILVIARCYNGGMNQDKVLARRIQRAREAYRPKMTQEELGKRLGIDQPAISKIENGTTQVGALRLVQIAKILDRPVTWFLSIDTGLSADEEQVLHLWRQIETPALQENTLRLLHIQVESDRRLRGGG